jgi:undecaprenyl-diphosphatase
MNQQAETVVETLNRTLFLWLNAPAHPDAPWLTLATTLADYGILLVPALLAAGWLWGGARRRVVMLVATMAGLIGLSINQMIGLTWMHPRPFMIDLGHTFLAHASDSSFPSDHATLLWSVAFATLRNRDLRPAGAALALFGVAVAWARIYLGVHFPLDMAGAAAVALASAWLAHTLARWYVSPAYRLAICLHRLTLRPLISLGWVRA